MEWWALPFAAFCFYKLDFDIAVHWAIISGALCWGLRQDERSIKRVTQAFALGVGASGVVALFQLAGWQGIDQLSVPGGLFLGKTFMGECAALALIASIQYRLWWSALICVLPLTLSTNRASYLGAALALWCFLSWRWCFWSLVPLAGALALAWYIGLGDAHSLMQRFEIWSEALHHLTLFGNGSYDFSTVANREPNLHNDWLQFIYELGIVGLIPIVLVGLGAYQNLPFTLALLVIASFGFPFHMPASAWFAAFIIGHHLGLYRDECRANLRTRHETPNLQRA